MKNKRVIVIILIIALIVPVMGGTIYSMNGVNNKANQKTKQEKMEIDIEKAQALANETGIDLDKIVAWYESSKDWTQVIKLASENKELGNDLSDTINVNQELEKEYSKEKIKEANELYNMIIFKLEEIISLKDVETYKQLKQNLDNEEAIYWMLKLEKELGTMQDALEEYLISIQLELDLNKYFKDKKEYQRIKSEKEVLYQKELITVDKIEQTALELLTNMNNSEEEKDTISIDSNNSNEIKIPSIDPKAAINIESEKPINPLDELNEEIKNIKPDMD